MKINKNFKINKINNPYEIWVIDDFLSEETQQRIKLSWIQIDDSKWHRGYDIVDGKENLLEKGMRAISDISKMPLFLQEILKFFHSDEFTRKLSEITNIENLISDETMRWSGLRVMEPNSYQLIHSDDRKHPYNVLTKELTCLYYLNENYKKNESEGCLEIWDDSMTIKTHEIEPINNRLVIFVNSETSYHGVPKVLKERKAITFSVMSTNSSSERSKALFVARPEDSNEIYELGIKRSKINDKK
jgi:Rps23 Pro-64 3,4-dihydroxylase Tpa1-like proline 4-hydroxylase